ncbi:MAG: tetratricopeptide repeat protein [Candidatus Omnitrophica bacterium]|nr:tetratricopeptide repeat protein [Candidatus Omnitrophota bacterium]
MNIRIVILFMFLVGGVAVPAVDDAVAANSDLISDAGALSKFMTAAAAYRAEDYDKAVAAYEAILRGGKESGALYYNLGNSYFKKGSLGKAILNYERARRLIPRDGDLNFNLAYARSKANLPTVSGMSWAQLAPTPNKDGVGVPTPDALGRDVGIDQRIRNWTDRELVWMLCGFALLLAAGHVSSLYGRWPRRARRGVIGSLCVAWLICAGGLAAKISAEKDLAVAVAAGEAKFEPREDATAHFRVTEGEPAKILEAGDSWAKIKRADGVVGWVPGKIFERF